VALLREKAQYQAHSALYMYIYVCVCICVYRAEGGLTIRRTLVCMCTHLSVCVCVYVHLHTCIYRAERVHIGQKEYI